MDYSHLPPDIHTLWQEILQSIDPAFVKPEWQTIDNETKSIKLLLNGYNSRGVGVTYGGKKAFSKVFPYLYVDMQPYLQGSELPAPPWQLAPVVDYFKQHDYQLIRSVNNGQPDFSSISFLWGSMLVFESGDTIAHVGWKEGCRSFIEPPFPGKPE